MKTDRNTLAGATGGLSHLDNWAKPKDDIMFPLPFSTRSLTGLFLLMFPIWTAIAASPDTHETWADRDRFPEAYSILTSDRVLFPDDVSDWPIKIDAKHQLFVDDYMIGSIENLTRQFHQPVKHPDNPLMRGGSVGVLRDEQTGKLRMWNGLAYLESTDGVHWTKPDLGPNGNRVFPERSDLRGIMFNPDIPEEQGRYRAVLERRTNKEQNEPGGFYLYRSNDGLKWNRNPAHPILHRTRNNMAPCTFRPMGVGNESNFQFHNPDHVRSIGVGDTSTFRYDTVLKRYICDGKFNLFIPQADRDRLGIVSPKAHLRLRTFSESDDLIHWTPPRFLMYPDRLDPPDRQIYAHVGFIYESMWIGIIQAMRVQPTGWKQVDLHLSHSRDGRHWSRPRQRQPFIPLGDADSWDPDYSGAPFAGPVLVGDELLFYYFGARHSKRDKNPSRSFPLHVGLARLRRDGFASLNAGNTVGRLLTRPLTFQGRQLFINAEVSDGGWVKAAVLSRDGEPIPGYTIDDAKPLTQDAIQGQMAWGSKNTLVPPGNEEHLRMLFQLKNARLYSFWIE